MPNSSDSSAQGYVFRLDGRDLVVRSYYLSAADSVKDYRITSDGTAEVVDATMINM